MNAVDNSYVKLARCVLEGALNAHYGTGSR